MLVGASVLIVACADTSADSSVDTATDTPVDAAPTTSAGTATDPTPDPALPAWDYQIGGAYEPAADVGVVFRDRHDPPDPGSVSVCYVNGFQTQPDEAAWWLAEHPDLILTTADGSPLIDPEWPDEMILDVSDTARRTALVAIVGAWIDACADSGFDAIEIDNLDTFTRFPTAIAADDAVAYAAALVERAHERGLAIGQKNAAELLDRIDATGFDFAIVEQCAEYDECSAFVEAFAGHGNGIDAALAGRVFDVEYDEDAFAEACTSWSELAPILRDLQVSTPDADGYLRATCA